MLSALETGQQAGSVDVCVLKTGSLVENASYPVVNRPGSRCVLRPDPIRRRDLRSRSRRQGSIPNMYSYLVSDGGDADPASHEAEVAWVVGPSSDPTTSPSCCLFWAFRGQLIIVCSKCASRTPPVNMVRQIAFVALAALLGATQVKHASFVYLAALC